MCPTRDRPTARRRVRLTSKAALRGRKQASISMPLPVRKALSDLPRSTASAVAAAQPAFAAAELVPTAVGAAAAAELSPELITRHFKCNPRQLLAQRLPSA